ncbi:DYH17 protein, partial [Spelaeornis formosus]|nr:DYH17 protein [Elachura formosa]
WDPGVGPAPPPCPAEAPHAPGAASSCGMSSCSRPYRKDPSFNPEFIKSKSTAAAGLCSWCLNMVRFYEVHCTVKPKRQAVAD